PPNTMTSERFDDGWTNVMFVGRVIPNKKFEDVIRAFHVYRTRHNPRSRLLLVGSYGGFEKDLAMFHGLVARPRAPPGPLPHPPAGNEGRARGALRPQGSVPRRPPDGGNPRRPRRGRCGDRHAGCGPR